MGLTKSRNISRTAPMKGIKAIGIAPFTVGDVVVNTATGVLVLPLSMTTVPTIARLEVRASGNKIDDNGALDKETRTSEFIGALSFFVPGNDDVLRKEIQGYAGILKTVFIEDYNGTVRCLGSQNGCDILTTSFSSDTQGWTITIDSREVEAAYSLTALAIADYVDAQLPLV
jgi:hypothetical protein